MIHRSDPDIVKRLTVFASSAAIFSVVVGLSVLAAWTLNIPAVLTWGAGTPMAPNAAACFVLAGFSLWLLREKKSRPSPSGRRLAAKASAALVSLAALLTLTEHLFRRDLGIDRILLLHPAGPQTASFRILMSPITAGAFLLFGLALQAIDWRTKRQYWVAQFLCLPVSIAPAFALLGLLWGPNVSPITVPVPTGVAFFALIAGLLCSRASWAMGGLLTRQSPGTTFFRRALPVGMLVLGLIGWLISRPLLTEEHFTWVEVSALATVTGALLAGFIAWTAIVVDRSDGQRRKLEEVLNLGQLQMDRLLEQVEEPETEARLRRWAEAAIAVAVLLTVLLSFLSWRGGQKAAEDAAWVAHTHEVMTMLESTLRHSLDVETGGRGFAETGRPPFLEPYEAGRRAVPQDLHTLRLLLVTADQQQRLHVLEEQANTQVKDVEEIVAERQNTGQVPTVPLFAQGKHDMDAVRVTVERMKVAERVLLEQRSQRARVAQHSASVVITLGSFLGVVFLSIAGITVSREIGVSARARAQVKTLNANLERRVEQRTAALEAEAAARQATDTKLRTSEEMFRTLLDGIKDYAVFMLDREGRVVSWNSGAARITGYAAEEIIGEHISRFSTATDRDLNRGQESLQEAVHAGRFEGQGWRVRKDGSMFWANAVITSLYEANGDVRGYSGVVRDITVSKHAEEEQKKQAALLDLALDAIFVRDLQSRVSFWNRGAQNMYGWSAAEADGRISHELLQTKFPLALADIEAAFASKGEWEGELRHTTRQGNEVVVTSRWALQRDERGAPIAILEINRDITDRKLAEAALRESESRLAGVIGSAMDAIITIDSEQRIVVFNAAAATIFRCSAAEAVGQTIERFIPQRFRSAHAAHVAQFGETGTTNRAMGQLSALWAVRADGEEFQIEASISQVEIAGNKMFTVILRDVTERRQAERTRDRLAAIVDSSDDAIISKTLEGIITAWNRGAEKIFGYPAEEAIGKPMLMLLPAERVKEEAEILAGISQGQSVEHFETVRVRKDGTKIDVSVTISPIRGGDGQIVGASKIARDITERKRGEDALRESEERFQVMANGIQQLAWMAEADGSIFWYNQRWYDYTGTTLAQTEGWTWEKIHDPAVLPEVLRGWKEAIANGTPFDMEFPLRGADGSYRMFLTRVMPVRNAEGHVVRWLGTNTDISERKKAEEDLARLAVELGQQAEDLARSRGDLEEQSTMLKLILESMGEGLVAADAEGHFLLWNDAANKLMGRGAADLAPDQWAPHYEVFEADGITPCPVERLPLVRALGGESVHEELMIRPPEPGEERFIEVTARPLKDARGTLRGGVAVLHDITGRKRSEAELTQQASELALSRQALEAQKLMLQSVLNSMVEGLVAADKQGKFILWNPAAEKIIGLGAADLLPEEWSAHYGTYLSDMVTPFPTERNPLQLAIQGVASSAEMFVRHPGLSQGAWIESNGAPLRDKGGAVVGGVVAFRDITQRRADELEIRKLNEDLEMRIAQRTAQLETANHELEAFSYSVSHDLRSPLRHIGGFSRILMNDFGSGMTPDAKDLLQRISDAVTHMGMLVDGLLSLAKLGRQSLKLRPIELNVIVAEAISALQPECEGREVEWRIAHLPVVECDEVLMGQVFQNLLGNAIKYSRGRTKAVIEVDSFQQADEPAVIFVRDNGAGFNMQYAEKLFGVFQRMHTEAEFEGTGVGLATVQRIIQKHGGRIWAEAEADHGATFYFTLGGNGETKTVTRLTATAQ
jgi:PAS domain S-box-containing protein